LKEPAVATFSITVEVQMSVTNVDSEGEARSAAVNALSFEPLNDVMVKRIGIVSCTETKNDG
jgi:hypothetical protein